MTATQSVDAAARATEDWIDDFVQRLGWRDRTRANYRHYREGSITKAGIRHHA